MNDELAGYSRLINLSLEMLHLDGFPEIQLDLLTKLLTLVLKMGIEDDISEPVVDELGDCWASERPPAPLLLIGFRDRVIRLGLERAQDFGADFEWASDLEDPSISLRALRKKVTQLAQERVGDPEAALAVLAIIDLVEGPTRGEVDVEAMTSVLRSFFDSVREHLAMARLVELEDTRVN